MQLVVQSGAEPGRVYELTSPKMIIGRQSGNDVVVPDEQVSRRHAQIEDRNGVLFIADLDSSNGTYVNGTRISSAQALQVGDTVQVGTTVMKVIEQQNKPAPSQPQGFAPTVRLNQGEVPELSPFATPMAPTMHLTDAPAVPADQPVASQPYQSQPASLFAPAAPAPTNETGYNQARPGYGTAVQENAPPPPSNYNYGPPPNYPGPQQQYAPVKQPPSQQQGLIIGNTVIPLPVVIGIGAIILLIIIILLIAVITGGAGSAVGELPAPKNNTRLEFNTKDVEELSVKATGKKVDMSSAKVGAFTTKESLDAVTTFYRDELKKKGWTEDTNRSIKQEGLANLFFTKNDLTAEITIASIRSAAEATAYTTIIPSFKDKIKSGDTLVVLTQIPNSALAK